MRARAGHMTRRLLFWAVLALFIALTAWWCVYFPFDRARLYRAVPREAVFVSEHERLAERWKEFAGNPLTAAVLAAAGVNAAESAALASDPAVADAVRRFAARDTVVGYAPKLGGTGKPAWVISSWLGARGQILRWWSRWGLVEGAEMRRMRLGGGRTAWVLETGRPEKLALAVVEGLLLGCYSEDAESLRILVDRIESGGSLKTVLQERLEEGGDDGCLDRGWFAAYVNQGGERVPYAFRYTLDAHDSGGSQGRLVGRLGRVVPPPAADLGSGAEEAARLIGTDPDLLVMAPCGYVKSLLAMPGAGAAGAAAAEGLGGVVADDAPVFVAMLGDELSGRILGLRVPTVLACARVADEAAGEKALREAMDRLNGRYGWSLLPRQIDTAGVRATVLDTGRGGVYGSMAPGERMAYAVRDGWLVLASNADVLVRLLGGGNKGGGTWAAAAGEHGAAAYAWADLESAGRATRNALAVYSLALIAQGSAGNEAARANLERIREWIAAAAPLKTCSIWLGSSGSDTDLRFRLGSPRAP
ncbi:MAG: DsbA family protein [Lentisphaerae bacterium]|nr:DsbA family protein [Lentisphaerota bacterium]